MKQFMAILLTLSSLLGCATTDVPVDDNNVITKADHKLNATLSVVNAKSKSVATGTLLNTKNLGSFLLLNKHALKNKIPDQLLLKADYEQIMVSVSYGVHLSNNIDVTILKINADELANLDSLATSQVKFSKETLAAGDKLLCAMTTLLSDNQQKRYYKTLFVSQIPTPSLVEVDLPFEPGESGSPCFTMQGELVGIAKGFHQAKIGKNKVGLIEVITVKTLPEFLFIN